jgi:hypothetical protein
MTKTISCQTGVDHDIITTQNNYRKAGGKLAQVDSIPACNSDKGCKTNTASPWKQRGDPIDEVPNYPAPTVPHNLTGPKSLVQKESVPACNSHTHPKCKDAKTDAPEHLAPLWKTDVELDEDNLIQSDPICNSAECDQYLHPKRKDDYPINYAVPDFGVDHDIRTTQTNSDAAGDFDPFKIPPDAYEANDFNLTPIWEREGKVFKEDWIKDKGMKHWLRKD